MSLKGPDPTNPYPMPGQKRIAYLKNIVKNPNIVIGDYTYYDDPDGVENFEKNVLYHYLGDKLIIGKFCAIAQGAKFLMAGAKHKLDCFTTYPFSLFQNGWEVVIPTLEDVGYKGDTVIGNDVWIGYEAVVMPGVHIGNGAIIGTRAVVTKDVAPYSIVAGVPAKEVRKRFDDEVIEILQKLEWWNWPPEKISENLKILTSNDIVKLKTLI